MSAISIRRLTRNVEKIPKALKISRKGWTDIGQVFIGNVLLNIKNQKQGSGKSLKRNKAPTRARKARAGLPPLSLVAEEKSLVKGGGGSWKILRRIPGGKGVVVGPATTKARNRSVWAQQKGYKGWLEFSKEGRAAVAAVIRREIKRQFDKIR